MDLEKSKYITQKFFLDSKVLNIDIINSGSINKTYIVEHVYKGFKSKYILQCLSNIFVSHEMVNINHRLITDHMKRNLIKTCFKFDNKRWEVPSLIKCKSNNLFVFPFESNNWRAMKYIDRSFSLDFLEDKKMACQVGIGLAKFHLICSDIDSSKLKETISNFHNTNYYIKQYIMATKNYNFNELDNQVNIRTQNLISSLSNHIVFAGNLFASLQKKLIDFSVIHGDPKISNFLFDIQSKHVVSLIDLDTVSSGYLITDLADCIRSICNLSGEDPKNKYNIYFDISCFKYFLKGYFSVNNEKTKYSFGFLPEFIYLLIFELIIRFLTDFLQSNRYFKIKYKTHNLLRAEVQYLLLLSFLSQIPNLKRELNDIGIYSTSTFVLDVQKIV